MAARATPAAATGPLLELRGVTKGWGAGASRHVVLDRVDLSVQRGEFLVIVGGSGTGKSTLLSLLAGLSRADAGSIRLAGREITGPGTDRGVVFQHDSLLPWLTVRGNIRLAVDQVFAGERPGQRDARVEAMIALVHLGAARDRHPHQLSGGMKQRVAVARAFAMDPELLLLDEPFSALDALTRGTMQAELERIWEADRKTVVMITNDVDEALLLADRIVPMAGGGALGEPIAVNVPRPREPAALESDATLRRLRVAVADRLREAGGSLAPSRGAVVALPDARPVHDRAHASPRPATSPAGKAFLELRGLEKSYATPQGPHVILQGIDFEVREHEFVSLIGHSGCGKTTIMMMVAGLASPGSGTILLDGERIGRPGPDRAMVFQSPSLLPWLTARENVLLGVDGAYPRCSRAERGDIADHYLARVGLAGCADRRPADLSAGMRQRVGVARAFALKPALLLLDEPFGSLDSVTRAELQDVLTELWQDTRSSALMVTHDVGEALLLSDRIALMTDGPAAVIGEVLAVPFARPRDRRELAGHEDHHVLRAHMLDFLEHNSRRDRPGARAAV